MPYIFFVNVQVSLSLCYTVGLWVYLLKRRIAVRGMEAEPVM